MSRSLSLTRRIVFLCTLLICLIALTGFSLNANRPKKAFLPCCSTCDVENPPLICRHGCSPDCAHKH